MVGTGPGSGSDALGASTVRAAPGPRDDIALPFRAEASRVNGRLVRLSACVDDILHRHAYPDAISMLLGEALTVVAILGSTLKFGTRLTLQTQTDGPAHFIVTDYQAPGHLRGYVGFDAERLHAEPGAYDTREARAGLLGQGRLAMTIDPGPGLTQYQGLVAIDNTDLADAALTYFKQSEQLPTFLRLAVSRHYDARAVGQGADARDGWRWRAGGLMLQYLTSEGGHASTMPAPEEVTAENQNEQPLFGEDDEGWSRTRMLAETVKDHELLDPDLPAEALLFRLFHEEGVRVYDAKPLAAHCACTRERIAVMLDRFRPDDLDAMRNDAGDIEVTCEFCSTSYVFERA